MTLESNERDRLLEEVLDIPFGIKARPSRGDESEKTPEELIHIARERLAKLTNLPISGVIGLCKTEEGRTVSFEVSETSSTTGEHILRVYDVYLDDYGDFLDFKRR